MLEAKARGDKETVKQLAKPMLDDYVAILDYPGCIFYEELMELYPEAKCLLTTRDAEAWYTSIRATLKLIHEVRDSASHRACPHLTTAFESTLFSRCH